jgi:hypothetical protein
VFSYVDDTRDTASIAARRRLYLLPFDFPSIARKLLAFKVLPRFFRIRGTLNTNTRQFQHLTAH